jgi:putative secretion ATPase (PEP-CTERM system associated)
MYENFYRLAGKPFSLNPDPRFFFASKGHARAMAYLEYGIHQEQGFIVITGEVGAGKTTLVRNLLESLSKSRLRAAQLVSTQLNADDLVLSVCLAFGLDQLPTDKAGQLARLEQFLRQTEAARERVLLIVDEVQNLSPEAVEELRMLSNFQGQSGPLLQSFLVGQPEFRGLLYSERMQQLRQRVIAHYHLGPMDEPDTRAYIEHRLSKAGWRQDPRFAEEIWPMIFRFTGGIPRRVNTFCDRLLLLGFIEELHEIGTEHAESLITELEEEFGGWVSEGTAPVGVNTDIRSDPALDRLAGDLAKLEKRLARIERMMLFNYRQNRQIVQILRATGHSIEDLDHAEVG